MSAVIRKDDNGNPIPAAIERGFNKIARERVEAGDKKIFVSIGGEIHPADVGKVYADDETGSRGVGLTIDGDPFALDLTPEIWR